MLDIALRGRGSPVTGPPFDCRNQAEIVEHGGTQIRGDPSNTSDKLIDQRVIQPTIQ